MTGIHIDGSLILSRIKLVRCHNYQYPTGTYEMDWVVIAVGLTVEGYRLLLKNEAGVWRQVNLADWEIKSA